MSEELLTKEISIDTCVEVSVYDLLNTFDDGEKRELARELIDEISTEYDHDLFIGEPSLEDEFKKRHFERVQNNYSLQELEQLLPNKEV
jgi:hypothetical protein